MPIDSNSMSRSLNSWLPRLDMATSTKSETSSPAGRNSNPNATTEPRTSANARKLTGSILPSGCSTARPSMVTTIPSKSVRPPSSVGKNAGPMRAADPIS
jgi:hypothetical protein